MVPLAAIQAVPIAVIVWYRLHRYAWYRYSAIVSYYEDFDTRDYPKGKFDETCMDAVPLSFHILSKATSFEDAIRLAISHGGDSDTIGAIVGSIAEARFGIPQEMKFKAMNYLPKDMTRIYQQFKANNEIKKIDKKYKK